MKELIEISVGGQQWSLYSYELFMGLGALAVLLFSMIMVHRLALPFWRSLLCLGVTALSVPVGARLLNIAINPAYYGANPEKMGALGTSGFSMMGGLFLAVMIGTAGARLLQIPVWRLGDATTPGLGLGIALMKVGCFLNGCCYGLPSGMPWAVRFPYGSPAHTHYLAEKLAGTGLFGLGSLMNSPSVHPTQLYEMAAALAAGGLSFFLVKKSTPSGVPCLAGLIFYISSRLMIHFFRVQPASNAVPLLFYPTIYSITLILAFICFRKRSSLP